MLRVGTLQIAARRSTKVQVKNENNQPCMMTIPPTSSQSKATKSLDDNNSHSNESIFAFQLVLWISALLIGSGAFHLAKLAFDGADWAGPLSLRKPALFGISGGLTTWSIAWLMTQLRPRRYDRALANAIAIGLLTEVALITLQSWRGVGSHFNHATAIDASIETAMLGLILAVTLGIFYLTFRTFRLRAIEPSMVIAIRSGMGLLSLSCGLGILTTVLGEVSIASGTSYELWGRAGVLKFPHGVALHAIQLLPIVAWFVHWLQLTYPVRLIQAILASQLFFLIYAVWQTSQGRDRFDWDAIGGLLLGISVLLGLIPALAIVVGCITYLFRKNFV